MDVQTLIKLKLEVQKLKDNACIADVLDLLEHHIKLMENK